MCMHEIAFPHKLLLICKARVPPLAVVHSCCLVTFSGYINKSGFHFLSVLIVPGKVTLTCVACCILVGVLFRQGYEYV